MFAFWPYFLGSILMIAMPLVLGWWIAKKRHVRWGLFFIGMVTFVGSQIFHIPFNWLILQRWQLIPQDTTVLSNLIVLSIFLGLSAGVFEEVARYLTYRFWAKDARSWGAGLMLGAGHGGVESILIGLSVGVNAVVLAAVSQGQLQGIVPSEQMSVVDNQVSAMLAAPVGLVLLGPLERVFALCAHLALSLLVMQVFVRRQIGWLALAILWHAVLDAVAVFSVSTWGPYVTEALIGAVALVSVGIIFWLRTPEPIEPELEPLPPAAPVVPPDGRLSEETLEKSKYS